MKQHMTKRETNPFDGSACARLRRMGLITAPGQIDKTAMDAFVRIFTASLFDDLRDAYGDGEQLSNILAIFAEVGKSKNAQKIFLMISLQYDVLHKPLPDPIWWLWGCSLARVQFSWGFTEYLSELAKDMEKTKKEDAPDETAAHSAP